MAGDYYSRISARFWVDTKGWGERNQLVALYLLTNVHSTMEGLYHLPLGYLCADLGLTPKQAQAALTFIEKAGVVEYDSAAEVVFIRKALKHGAPKTGKHITGAINRLKAVPLTPLWGSFLMACECHAKALWSGIQIDPPMPLDCHSSGIRMPFESSISSSSSIPPVSPQGGNDIPAPVKPIGNRKRDVEQHEHEMAEWCQRYFPNAADPRAVRSAILWARLSDPVTAGDLLAAVSNNDMWAAPLGLPTTERGAA